MKRILLSILVLGAVAALFFVVIPKEKVSSPSDKTVTFYCQGDKSITATFHLGNDTAVDLKLSDGRTLSVPRAISASGARYANADETFVFWNKGDTAFITEGVGGTETYSDCALPSPQNATYTIEGKKVTLRNGLAEEPIPGSSSKIVTRYFGNELTTDLNGDGREDVAFILTQERGGTGVFFYAVAALNTENGYIGSDGYLLGDRIAPQSTNVSPNPRHKYVVVFNYAVRMPGEPMTAAPSVGKSVYLKIDPTTVQWGIVVPDFEGESNQ